MTINFSDITEDSGQESIESEYWHSYLYSCISFMFSNVCLSQKKEKSIWAYYYFKNIRTQALAKPTHGPITDILLVLFLYWKKDQGKKGNRGHEYSQ